MRLMLWGRTKRKQDLKNRIISNREGVLNAFAENIKGARQCPILLGNKCIGGLCELFMEFKSTGGNGKEIRYHRCAYTQTPLLIIEVANEMRKVVTELRETQKAILTVGDALLKKGEK